MGFAENLKEIRKKRNITQEQLADMLSVSRQAISKWEKDTGLPDIRQIIPLANVFRVSTDVLLGVEPPVDNAESVHDWILRVREGIDESDTETLITALNTFKQCPREYDDAPELRMTRLMLGYQILCAGDIKLTAVHCNNFVSNRKSYSRTPSCIICLEEFCLYLRQVMLAYSAACI